MAARKTGGTDKFGWCLTGHHKQCIIEKIGDKVCGCNCHKPKPVRKSKPK